MDYLQAIPTELIEIIISFFNYDNLKSFIELIPYPDLINWHRIYNYHFINDIPKVHSYKELYLTHLAIESLKNKLPGRFKPNESFDDIYKMISLNLYGRNLTLVPMEIERLYNLQSLDLTNNKLTSLPEW